MRARLSFRHVLPVSLLAMASEFSRLLAAPADMDTSFGADGFVTTTPGGGSVEIGGAVIQPDKKIFVAGSMASGTGSRRKFLLLRYLQDGSLDPAFGSGGVVAVPFRSSQDYVNDVALQPDGRIVLVGSTRIGSSNFVAIARFQSDGTLDPSFSGDGMQISSAGSLDHVGDAVAIQPDGRIVVAGSSSTASGRDFTLYRFLADGSRDPGFGNGGSLLTDFDGGRDGASAVAIQSDRKIVVAGTSRPGGNRILGALARYLADGTLDPSFGMLGKLVIDIPISYDWLMPESLTIDPDGRILLAGTLKVQSMFRMAAIRLLPDGTTDRSFGVNGIAETDFGGDGSVCKAMTRAADGKLLLVGSSRFPQLGASDTVAIARFLEDGRLDEGFSDDGWMTVGFGGVGIAEAVKIQSDGRIVLAGVRAIGNPTVHLARLVGDPQVRVESVSPPELNRQTGLYEQRVEIVNLSSMGIAGFDLAITGLAAGVSVYNASKSIDGDYVVTWRQEIASGARVTLVIEYFAAMRGSKLAMAMEPTAIFEPIPLSRPEIEGLAVDRCLVQSDGSILLEFSSVPGSLYEVQYSEDGKEWVLSPVLIRAAGSRVQWIDRGPPRTVSPPAESSCRFYRVREIP